MKEKVAVATVQGRAYFLIVNALREQQIGFVSLIPGEFVPSKVKVVITTEEEKNKVKYERTLILHDETDLDSIVVEVKKLLLGKETYEKIVVGIDPGEVNGLAILADGKVVEESNCYSNNELIQSIIRVIKTVDLAVTEVVVKVGNGVPLYREVLEDLDYALPQKVILEVVGEAGTNRPMGAHSRMIRHISSAIRIAGRNGPKYKRRQTIASHRTTE